MRPPASRWPTRSPEPTVTGALTETVTVDASETDPTPDNGNDTVTTCP
ncbi:hypothetical protein ABZY16_40285 [Streptomyces sp. NPDC006553]